MADHTVTFPHEPLSSTKLHAEPGATVSLAQDTYALHPFDALNDTLANLTTTLVESTDLADSTRIRVPYTEPGKVDFVREGATIPESETNIRDLVIPSRKLASIKVVSNEIRRSTKGEIVTGLVSGQALEDVKTRANTAMFGVTGTSHTEDTGAPVPLPLTEGATNLGPVGKNLDQFIDGIAKIIELGGKEADMRIVCDPRAWAYLAKIKESDGGNRALTDTVTAEKSFVIPNATGQGTEFDTITEMQVRTLLGIPLFVSRDLTDPASNSGTIFLFDSKNIVTGASQIEITYSDEYAFNRDSAALRTTYRLGWKVYNPARLCFMSTPAPAHA